MKYENYALYMRAIVYHMNHLQGLVSDQPISTPASRDFTAGPSTSRSERAKPVNYSTMFQALDDSLGNYHQLACRRGDSLVDYSPDDLFLLYDATKFSWQYGTLNRITTGDAPLRYSDIADRSDRLLWEAAADAEMAQLAANMTFTLVPPPPDRNVMKSKWVFKVKRDPDGQITKHKARLVACGFTQKKGVDYNETYSPVARSDSLRFFLTICAALGIRPHKMDVTGAFLYGVP